MDRFTSRKKVPPSRSGLELLCRVKLANPVASMPKGCFGNIIELGSKSLLLETSRDYDIGDSIVIEVVFPGQKRSGKRISEFQCIVRKVDEEPDLHYSVDIQSAADIACERLDEFLNRAADRALEDGGKT